MLEHITLVASSLPTVSGKVSHNLTVSSMRHLHYLTLARFPILQYCCKLLLLAIKVIIFFCSNVLHFFILINITIDMVLGKFFFTWNRRGTGSWTCVSSNADRLAAGS